MPTVNVTTVVGARPQFIKAAAVSRAIADLNRAAGEPRLRERIVHTGQHYDPGMSQVFFDEIGIPPPAVNLEVGSGSHGHQTGRMLERLEQDLVASRPDWVLIYGDTNSTLAGALASAKLHVPVAHVEAGLRSYNRRMPEEINRVVADGLSTLLFCPTRVAVENLAKEGITQGVHRVGDVMYDSVLFHASQAERRSDMMARLGLKPKSFYLATVHRAENTDDAERLSAILASFAQIRVPVVIPMHPRTRKTLGTPRGDAGARAGRARLAATRARLASERVGGEVRVIDPVSYLDMLALERNARIILTDSGGVQKEAYWFGVPCVTLRDETEWVELVEAGCNRVVGADPRAIGRAVADFEAAGASLPPDRPADLYGDGHGAEKIVALLGARP